MKIFIDNSAKVLKTLLSNFFSAFCALHTLRLRFPYTFALSIQSTFVHCTLSTASFQVMWNSQNDILALSSMRVSVFPIIFFFISFH